MPLLTSSNTLSIKHGKLIVFHMPNKKIYHHALIFELFNVFYHHVIKSARILPWKNKTWGQKKTKNAVSEENHVDTAIENVIPLQ